MNADAAINQALREAGLSDDIDRTRNLSGGCIHQVTEVTLRDGTTFVVKINDESSLKLFEEEADGLRALAETNTVLVPQPLATLTSSGAAVLLMTAIPHGAPAQTTWQEFGRELASLHAADTRSDERYGFEFDNHLGSTFQPNAWHDDWVEFNAVNRLGFQLKLARERHLLSTNEGSEIESIIDRLEQFIPRKPRPSLLHGDLWSGNAIPAKDNDGQNRIAMIDPACSIGDGWADIAMMKLFGGFPTDCIEAYAADNGDHKNLDFRISVYQLYHVLNHVNIFGRGYVSQALALASTLK